jgi:transposase-like protein
VGQGLHANDLVQTPAVPADVIRHAVWLCFRFTLSFQDVEDMLAEPGIEVSYETIRCWTISSKCHRGEVAELRRISAEADGKSTRLYVAIGSRVR